MTGFLDSGIGGVAGVDTGDIGHSLRFRSAASAYASRTITTDATSTYFAAVKRGKLGVVSPIFDTNIKFNANDTLTAFGLTTTAVFRDPTSWLFIHVSNGGLYVNGVSYGAVTTSSITNPRIGFDGTNYFDGCIARIGCVAGSSSAYTNFGYQNTEINEWVSLSQSAVKAVVDAGGTNSFMLDFDDPNFATYNVGKDYSSKGNHWTPNNFSLTAGTTYDHMLDVPGNSFCTASPIDLGANPGSSSLTEANLKSACSAVSGGSSTCGTQALGVGKWYWEIVPTAIGNGLILGITSRTSGAPSGTAVGYVFDGTKNIAGSGSAYGATYAANDVIGVAVDTTANTIEFFKNNVSQGVITNATYVVPGCKPLHWNNSSSGSSTVQHNYGQAPLHASATYHSAAGGYFRYAPPSGYLALCQRNMPDPAILNPEKHFDVLLHTGGASASQNVTGTQFQPDLAWFKGRTGTNHHALFDSIRGANKGLYSSLTNAENTWSGQAFLSNGFTVDRTFSGETNGNGVPYVDWLWKAGGAAVTNNAGSISSQVSANVEAGFSIVTYTGTGANATVGHGLGKAPKLILVKSREDGIDGWYCYVQPLGATKGIFLNLTSAAITSNVYWNDTDPTSSVFTVKGPGATNRSGDDYVAYCFAEIAGFSKIFSYTGNGNADGPFVHCGFKPKFILYKRSDAASSWVIWDSMRSPDNVVNDYLLPNSSAAEATLDTLDILSNGFKLRTANADNNGGTIIGIAFADVPGKYALAR